MNTQYEIHKAISHVEQIDEAAYKLRDEINTGLDEAFAVISKAWQGEYAEMFLKKCRQVQLNLDNTADKITDTAQKLDEELKKAL